MDTRAKRSLLAKIPYGLYVCTSRHADETSSMLCTWVAQASFDPPMITLAVQKDTHSYAIIRDSGAFCLNFLPAGARDTAVHFARPYHKTGPKLEKRSYKLSPVLKQPVISEALGYLEMKVAGFLEGGDHDVILAEVVGAGICEESELFTQADAGFKYAG